MNTCRVCGREIAKGRKYCCNECRFIGKNNEIVLKHPVKYTHCQNPECGKKLNHWIIVNRKSGNNHRKYHYDKKYCDMKCSARHKSINMTGKESNNKGHFKENANRNTILSNLKNDFIIDEFQVIYD